MWTRRWEGSSRRRACALSSHAPHFLAREAHFGMKTHRKFERRCDRSINSRFSSPSVFCLSLGERALVSHSHGAPLACVGRCSMTPAADGSALELFSPCFCFCFRKENGNNNRENISNWKCAVERLLGVRGSRSAHCLFLSHLSGTGVNTLMRRRTVFGIERLMRTEWLFLLSRGSRVGFDNSL